MSLIEWNKSYEIGIESVDHEHKEMIDLINALYADLQADAEKAEITRFLGEIHSKISAHFALEEKVMRELEYDEMTAHKDDHEVLLDEIRNIMDAYEDGGYTDMKDRLANHLETWFTEHFRTRDSRLHRFLHDPTN